jgi:hypothetical protein
VKKENKRFMNGVTFSIHIYFMNEATFFIHTHFMNDPRCHAKLGHRHGYKLPIAMHGGVQKAHA